MSRSHRNEVRAVVIPTGAVDLLLPNAAVAEVITFDNPTPLQSAPAWLLGRVFWRGCAVPAVSLSRTGAEPGQTGRRQRARLIVCYTPSGNSALPYVGILAIGPPRLALLSAQALEPAQIEPGNPFVLHGLAYAERQAFIPDMDAVERAVLEAIQP